MADTAKMTGTERILSAGRSLNVTENGVYYGAGTPEMFDEYVDFINYVFGFNGNSDDFKKLLPKLYRYELDPAGNSYVAVENGKIRAAVGAFDHDIVVCGKLLKTRGIGNVAVHPYERSRGFMRKLMNMAVDGMVADGEQEHAEKRAAQYRQQAFRFFQLSVRRSLFLGRFPGRNDMLQIHGGQEQQHKASYVAVSGMVAVDLFEQGEGKIQRLPVIGQQRDAKKRAGNDLAPDPDPAREKESQRPDRRKASAVKTDIFLRALAPDPVLADRVQDIPL